MASPTPVIGILLTSSQQDRVRKLHRKQKRRENARWLREGVMTAMSQVGLYDKEKAANGMYVASVQVEGQEVHNNVTYFRLRVHGSSGLQWHVLHRFSDFYTLRKQLGVRDKRVGTIFPQKTWFTSGNHAVFLLKQRQELLQIWIDGLLREFATGGDGRNSLIAINWTNKLVILHTFFGVESPGRLLSHARLAEAVPAIEEAAPANSTLAPPAWAVASAPPMEEAVAEPVAAHDEDEDFRAALAASAASHAEEQARQRSVEEASLAAEEEEQARQRSVEEARLAAEEEEQARQRSVEEARLAAEEEESRANATAALERMAAEAEESKRSAQLAAEEELIAAKAEAKRIEKAAEEELIAAKAEAKRIKNADMLATRRKMEEEAQARRKAEEEEVRRKAEEEDAKRKVEEEEMRQQAEEQAKKPWLEQALDMAGLARQLEDQGQTEQALDHYKKCIAMFMMAWRKETSEKIKGAIQEKVADMTRRTKELTAVIAATEVAQVAEIMSVPVPVGSPDVASLKRAVDTTVEAPIVTATTSASEPAPRLAVAS